MRSPFIRRSAYGSFDVVSNCCGDRRRHRYGVDIDPRGNLSLYDKGEYDLYLEIQSYRDGTDIHSIVKRYEMTGDPQLLNINWSLFGGSAVGVPTDIRSAYTVVKEAERVYKSLPSSEAAKFSSFSDFLGKIHNYKPVSNKTPQSGHKTPQTVKSEVKDNVTA